MHGNHAERHRRLMTLVTKKERWSLKRVCAVHEERRENVSRRSDICLMQAAVESRGGAAHLKNRVKSCWPRHIKNCAKESAKGAQQKVDAAYQ